MNDAKPGTRRGFLAASAASLAAISLPTEVAAQPSAQPSAHTISGSEHWVQKRVGADTVKLFLWRKRAAASGARNGTILFVGYQRSHPGRSIR